MLIATYITAIVRASVSGPGTASWLIAPTEGIPALIHMDDSGISVVALLGLHTYPLLHQLHVFIQPLFIAQCMSANRLLQSNTNSRNCTCSMDSFMMKGEIRHKLK